MGNVTKRYKIQLFSAAELQATAAFWEERLAPIRNAWRGGALTDAEVSAFYLLHSLEIRLPDNWLCGPSRETSPHGPRAEEWFSFGPRTSKKIPAGITVGELLEGYHLKGVRMIACRALSRWLRGEILLKATESIPTADEILDWQVNGGRWVTLTFDQNNLNHWVHDGRDALSFLLHDLAHADQFFRNPTLARGQIGCYRMLQQARDKSLLQVPSLFDSQWSEQMDYLIADLNTHPIHFWGVFWGRARQAFGKSEIEFSQWRDQLCELWAWPEDMNDLTLRMSPQKLISHGDHLLNFLIRQSL